MDKEQRIRVEAKLIRLLEEHFTPKEIEAMRDFSIHWDLFNIALLPKDE